MARSRETGALTGRTAVVTGAASGLGLALSAALTRRGARVWMADLDEDAVHRAAGALAAGCADVRAHRLDVTDRAALEELLTGVDRDGGLDLVFNNAGVGGTLAFDRATPAHWDRILALNLRSVIDGTSIAYDLMRARGRGQIVNTASISGVVPVPLQTLYNTTKAAVVALSTTLRPEAGAHGVRVNVVCPGNVATGIFTRPILEAGSGAASTAGRAGGASGAPAPRPGVGAVPANAVPADVAAEVVLRGLARDDALIVLPARARRMLLVHRRLPALSARRMQRMYQRRAASAS